MENRRGPRYVIDPVVRQVGFVTPGSELPNRCLHSTMSIISTPAADGSSSPVIIPTNNLETSPKPSLVAAASLPPPWKQPSIELLMPGSYNPTGVSVTACSSPVSSYHSKQHSNGMLDNDPSQSLDNSSSLVNKVSSGIERLSFQDDCEDKCSTGLTSGQVEPTSGQVQPLESTNLSAAGDAHKEYQSSAHSGQAPTKSLKERTTKAERRAKQEADREAKRATTENAGEGPIGREAAAYKGKKVSEPQIAKKETRSEKKSPRGVEKKGAERPPEKEKKKEIMAPRLQFDDEHRVAKAKRRALIEQTEMKNRVELFRHLPQFTYGTQLPSLEAKFFHDDLIHPHPAVYQVGLQYVTGDIVGGNARCVAMLLAFREIIKSYSTPKEKTLVRDLTTKINSNVSFLTTCRPLSISMGNAIRYLKTRIAKLPMALSEGDSKSRLMTDIDCFIQEKIIFSDKEIINHAVTKIRDGDVILTYSPSCVVEMILLHAFELGCKFRVIIVDSRPKLEGKSLLKRLLGKGLSCIYTHINALSYVMQEVTKVFLGASSILSNGTVYSRVGTACVAMVAHSFHVPVLVCCETYKFHERVQLDSICSNELGDPDALAKVPGRNDLRELDGWDQSKHLQLLNLTYDATPADYVSMIVTELGMVPPTSVSVILREYRKEPMLSNTAH